jgi:hypothetical protein
MATRSELNPKELNRLIVTTVGGQEDTDFLDQETQNLKLGDNLSDALMMWLCLPPSQSLPALEEELPNVAASLPPLSQLSWSSAENLSQEQCNLLGLALLNALRKLTPDPNRE